MVAAAATMLMFSSSCLCNTQNKISSCASSGNPTMPVTSPERVDVKPKPIAYKGLQVNGNSQKTSWKNQNLSKWVTKLMPCTIQHIGKWVNAKFLQQSCLLRRTNVLSLLNKLHLCYDFNNTTVNR